MWQTCIGQVVLVSVKKCMLLPRYRTVIDALRFVSWAERQDWRIRLTVLHILKERLGMRKIASRWVPHDLTEMQKWLRYDAARNNLERYEREGGFVTPYHYAGWDMGQIVRATKETPIELMASLRFTTKIRSSSEPQQCESYGDSRVRLWWCYPNAYRSPTADRQCAVLLFIFGTQPATSFEKEVATLSAEPTHHFAGQCSAACSASCGWFVWSMGLGSAVPSTILPGLKPLWLRLDS